MMVPEDEEGTPVSRVRPATPFRRYESPRSVMLCKESDEKWNVMSSDACDGFNVLQMNMSVKKTRWFLEFMVMI